MEHFIFGRNNGLRVSALALGAGNFGTRWGYGADADTSRQIFDKFADTGGTFIDTAASYQVGESEEILGHMLAGRRDQFTVATKFALGGEEGTGVLQTGNGRRAMFRSVEGSLLRGYGKAAASHVDSQRFFPGDLGHQNVHGQCLGCSSG